MFEAYNLDPKNREYKYNPDNCDYFLQHPALIYPNAYDSSCNEDLEGKWIFYNEEQLEEYVLWEREFLIKEYAKEKRIPLDNADVSLNWIIGDQLNLCKISSSHEALNKAINKVKEKGMDIYHPRLMLSKDVEKDIQSLHLCYYNPFHQQINTKTNGDPDPKKLTNQLSTWYVEGVMVNENGKLIKPLYDQNKNVVFHSKEEGKDVIDSGNDRYVSVVPLPESAWDKALNKILFWKKKDTTQINTSVILVRVEKKEGYCYGPKENHIIRSVLVYGVGGLVETIGSEFLASTVVGTAAIPTLHFTVGAATAYIENKFKENEKWPKKWWNENGEDKTCNKQNLKILRN